MASGSFQSSTSYSCYAYILWYSTAGTGGSTVYANIYFKALYRYNFTFRDGYCIGINNNNKYGNGAKVTSAGDWLLLSHSVWVGYTGNCSVGISGYANCTSITNSSTGHKLPVYNVGGVAALDKVGTVPSTPTLSPTSNSSISEVDKTITLTWNKSSSYNGKGTYRIDVSINGGAWSYVSGDIGFDKTSWTYTIPNHSQGTNYRFRISCGNDVGWSGHTSSGLFTINKLGVGGVWTWENYNPYVDNLVDGKSYLPVNFWGGSQNVSGDLYYKAQLYYNNSPVDSTIFSSNKNEDSLKITYPATTYTNKLGVDKHTDTFMIKAWVENQNGTKSDVVQTTFKVDINSDGGAEPTVEDIIFTGGAFNNPSTCFIIHESTISVQCGNVSLRRAPTSGESLTAYYSIKNDNTEISKTSSGKIECSQTGTFTCSITVRDSRGLSTTVQKQYVVQPYTSPRIVISSSGRDDKTDTNVVINYKVYYSPIYQYLGVNIKGDQLNGVSVQQYSKDGESWNNYSTGKIISGVDVNYSYTFEVRIADKFKTTSYVSDSCIIPTIKSLMSIRSHGVGFGCIPQVGHSLEVGGDAQLNDNLTVAGVTSMNDLVQIRGGSNEANKRLLDFGWDGSTAKHSIVLETSGSLRFTAYQDSGSANAMYISESGEITAGTVHNKLLDVSNTLKASSITPYSNDLINIQAITINNGLLRSGNTKEWIGMYDVNTPTDRYFWMGRNKDTNKIFHFNGESSIDKFDFNKPIWAPQILNFKWASTVVLGSTCGITFKYRYNDYFVFLYYDGSFSGNTGFTAGTGYSPGDGNLQSLIGGIGNFMAPVATDNRYRLAIRYYPTLSSGKLALISLDSTTVSKGVYIAGNVLIPRQLAN